MDTADMADAQTPFDQIAPASASAAAPAETLFDLPPASPQVRTRADGWTIPLVCIGIGIIACCVIIAQTDSNRRLVYEREKLKRDLEYVERQVEVNDDFLRKVA